jgi:hypothetical protein
VNGNQDVLKLLVHPHLRKDFRQFWAQTQAAIRDGRLADAIAIGAMFANHPSAPNIVKYGYGCLLMMAGEVDRGREIVAAVGSFNQGSDVYGTSFFGYDAQKPLSRPLIQPFAVRRAQIQQWQQAELLIVSACDLRYFKRFYAQLVHSVKRFRPLAHGVVFLVAMNDEEFNEACKLGASQDLDSVIPVRFARPRLDSRQLRVGFACARWSALSMLIDHLRDRQQLLILDVDMTQVRSGDELLQGIDSDVSLLLYSSEFMNLMAFVSGSLVRVSAGRGGIEFIKQSAKVIDLSFDQGLIDWHLDQFALLMAYLSSQVAKYELIPQELVLSMPFFDRLTEQAKLRAVFESRTASIAGFG